MPALSEYSNVYNTALVVLRRKGFQVWYEKARDVYCAERGGWDFEANTPCGLLGVVAIFEEKQPSNHREYWWKEDTPALYGSFPEHPPREYVPVWLKK
jgi:hypothetical protein